MKHWQKLKLKKKKKKEKPFLIVYSKDIKTADIFEQVN